MAVVGMANRVVEQLEDLIRRFEVRMERLRSFRDMVNEDPAFVADQ
jgi:hypothetical protein